VRARDAAGGDDGGAASGLQARGLVRWIGLCNYNAAGLAAALATGVQVASLQTPVSMIRREFFSSGLRDMCVGTGPEGQVDASGSGCWRTRCWGAGCSGGGMWSAPPMLAAGDLRAADARFHGAAWLRIRRLGQALVAVAARLEVPPAALAIAWVLRQAGVSVAVVGARGAAQVHRAGARARAARARPRVAGAAAPRRRVPAVTATRGVHSARVDVLIDRGVVRCARSPMFVMAAMLSAATVLAPLGEAHAALNAYLKLKGQKAGEIKGSVTQKGREGGIKVISVAARDRVAARRGVGAADRASGCTSRSSSRSRSTGRRRSC
jgi:hypothetical protein